MRQFPPACACARARLLSLFPVLLAAACSAPPRAAAPAWAPAASESAAPRSAPAALEPLRFDDAPVGSQQAASGPASDSDAAQKQANNPIADMKAFNLQNYAIREVEGVDDSANQFWFRYAQPVKTGFGDWLVRASLPLLDVPVGGQETESGIGDSNVFAAYLFDTANPAVSFGVGPLLGIPTATDDDLGTDQWSAGLAAVAFDGRSSLVQYGGLVTYQHKIGGSDRLDDVSLLAIQPFGFLQLGGGTYLRSVGIWAFDLESGDYSVPVGMGVGHVVKAGKTVFNFYVEPQFTVLEDGPGQPQFQLLFGFNTQFLGM